jgi:hypothetical protein
VLTILLMDDAHHGDFTSDQPVTEMLPRVLMSTRGGLTCVKISLIS